MIAGGNPASSRLADGRLVGVDGHHLGADDLLGGLEALAEPGGHALVAVGVVGRDGREGPLAAGVEGVPLGLERLDPLAVEDVLDPLLIARASGRPGGRRRPRVRPGRRPSCRCRRGAGSGRRRPAGGCPGSDPCLYSCNSAWSRSTTFSRVASARISRSNRVCRASSLRWMESPRVEIASIPGARSAPGVGHRRRLARPRPSPIGRDRVVGRARDDEGDLGLGDRVAGSGPGATRISSSIGPGPRIRLRSSGLLRIAEAEEHPGIVVEDGRPGRPRGRSPRRASGTTAIGASGQSLPKRKRSGLPTYRIRIADVEDRVVDRSRRDRLPGPEMGVEEGFRRRRSGPRGRPRRCRSCRRPRRRRPARGCRSGPARTGLRGCRPPRRRPEQRVGEPDLGRGARIGVAGVEDHGPACTSRPARNKGDTPGLSGPIVEIAEVRLERLDLARLASASSTRRRWSGEFRVGSMAPMAWRPGTKEARRRMPAIPIGSVAGACSRSPSPGPARRPMPWSISPSR